jgi:group I intron endonuclease
MPSRQCVYAITCTTSGRTYVGASTRVQDRWSNHKADLRHGRHDNSRMQRDWDQHGRAAFKFAVVEDIDDAADLPAREAYWIDVFQTTSPLLGYNDYLPGVPSRVTPWPKDFSDRIKAGLRGVDMTKQRQAVIASNIRRTGERHTPEAGARISAAITKWHADRKALDARAC